MSKEDFEGIKQYAKEQHAKRVTDNPNRIQYAIQQFEKHNIEYVLKNETTGHFHCRRKSDDKLFQFYAGTGKIMGYDNIRGIHSLISLLDDVESKDVKSIYKYYTDTGAVYITSEPKESEDVNDIK